MKPFSELVKPKDGWRVVVDESYTQEGVEESRMKLTMEDRILVSEPVQLIYKEKATPEQLGSFRVNTFLLEAIATYLNAGKTFDELVTFVNDLWWLDKYRFDYEGWYVVDIGLSPSDNQYAFEFQHPNSDSNYYWITDVFVEAGNLSSYLCD